MKRRDLDYVVITLLVGSSLYVFFTGLIADSMGLHHFGWHSQVGYFWMALAVTHLIQTWVRVKAFVRNRFRETKTPSRKRLSAGVPSAVATQSIESQNQRQAGVGGQGRRNFLLAMLAIATGIGFDQLVTPGSSSTDKGLDGLNVQGDLGLLYHQWSQPGYSETIDTLLNWGNKPALYKTYANAQQIDLPRPDPLSVPLMPLATAITTRRSRRSYKTQSSLSLAQLSQLLHLAHGITWEERDFRTVPSSGALYPLEIYPIVHRVEGLEPGLYHHAVEHHRLALVTPGDLRQPLIKAGLSQDFLGEAAVCFVVSGLFQRTRWKYHERTYRYVLMEVGHLGQNLYLAATALGLGVCGIGAFFDDPLNQLLGLDGETEAAMYLVTVGEID